MRRYLSVLLAVCLCCGLLAGCGGKSGEKPENMNQEIYNYGVKAVDAIDSFLEADITAEEAEEKLSSLSKSADSVSSEEVIDSSVQASLNLLEAQLRGISYDDLSDDVESEDLSKLREARDSLKKTLNIK